VSDSAKSRKRMGEFGKGGKRHPKPDNRKRHDLVMPRNQPALKTNDNSESDSM